MAGGYARPPEDSFGEFLQIFRQVEQRLRELERPTGTQIAQAVQNLERAQAEQAAIVADLSVAVEQLGDISKSTSATSGGFSRVTNGTTNNLAALPSLSLVLDRPSRVLVTGSTRIIGDAGASSINPTLRALVSWSTNHSPATAICSCNFLNQIIPPAGQIVRSESSLSSSEVLNVPAGLLEINAYQASIELNGGGGGSAIIQASPITISAIVLPQ